MLSALRLIMFYHSLSLLHVGFNIFFGRHALELLTQLLVGHLNLEHLGVELHRSVLNVEAIFGRDVTLCGAVNETSHV